jgi:hypothetical protein
MISNRRPKQALAEMKLRIACSGMEAALMACNLIGLGCQSPQVILTTVFRMHL